MERKCNSQLSLGILSFSSFSLIFHIYNKNGGKTKTQNKTGGLKKKKKKKKKKEDANPPKKEKMKYHVVSSKSNAHRNVVEVSNSSKIFFSKAIKTSSAFPDTPSPATETVNNFLLSASSSSSFSSSFLFKVF